MKNLSALLILTTVAALPMAGAPPYVQSATEKPILHGRHWMAITGKPAGAMAGARMFEKGGNAVDAACAMLAVVCTMFDDVSWGGETQALIFDPRSKKVVGVNGLGFAPSGATPSFFKDRKLSFPPAEGPLAATIPGNPGALMLMLAGFGTLSLQQVLEPAMQMAEGYPIESELVRKLESNKAKLKQWPYSKSLFFTHPGEDHEAPHPGELFRQPDLLETLKKLTAAEADAIAKGKSRQEAILAAHDRFYKGDIAEEFCRASKEMGGLHTLDDFARWRPRLETPVSVAYKGIEVYKLTVWTQGPAMLQALNLLERFDLRAMGYNSTRYIHALYQSMNLAFADRDFYYGDPTFPPVEPVTGLLSKEYASHRAGEIRWDRNHSSAQPGDPYPFEGKTNPYEAQRRVWQSEEKRKDGGGTAGLSGADEAFLRGTTSIQAADKSGWAVSVTPSGGWIPVCIAGRTGIGMSQRMQSFVLSESENPFNVVAPHKQPRVTLTPTMALTNGRPFLCFSVQGGDTQDQNLLQFFLNVVEFGMNVQEASEAANITSYQMRASFDAHVSQPGRLTLNEATPPWVRRELGQMGYKLDYQKKSSGPITAIYFDRNHDTLWGAASNHGEDYGIAW
ncbi:MAG: gamma-glutamyltransferase family protein [Verrucomicrobia bacterium]|nr:gamma-glutamyltransferase family protein [Verrucomicrobiota bacterium]